MTTNLDFLQRRQFVTRKRHPAEKTLEYSDYYDEYIGMTKTGNIVDSKGNIIATGIFENIYEKVNHKMSEESKNSKKQNKSIKSSSVPEDKSKHQSNSSIQKDENLKEELEEITDNIDTVAEDVETLVTDITSQISDIIDKITPVKKYRICVDTHYGMVEFVLDEEEYSTFDMDEYEKDLKARFWDGAINKLTVQTLHDWKDINVGQYIEREIQTIIDNTQNTNKDVSTIQTSYEKTKIAIHYRMLGAKMYKAIKAMNFAIEYHNGKRKDGSPEFSHQVFIANFAMTLPINNDKFMETLLCAIFLHDICEDYDVSFDDISRLFGEDISVIVNCLTKVVNGNKLSEEEYVEKLKTNIIAMLAKGCDRLHNISTMWSTFTIEKQISYTEETINFILPLLKYGRKNYPEYELCFENIKQSINGRLEIIQYYNNKQNDVKI